jgi:hypothetical protein
LSHCARGDHTAGPREVFSRRNWIPTASVISPMMPPRASTSRTRCPLAMPPMAGLHDICAIRSTFSVKGRFCRPMRAAAMAASHPAWPAPTTTTSNCSVKDELQRKSAGTRILDLSARVLHHQHRACVELRLQKRRRRIAEGRANRVPRLASSGDEPVSLAQPRVVGVENLGGVGGGHHADQALGRRIRFFGADSRQRRCERDLLPVAQHLGALDHSDLHLAKRLRQAKRARASEIIAADGNEHIALAQAAQQRRRVARLRVGAAPSLDDAHERARAHDHARRRLVRGKSRDGTCENEQRDRQSCAAEELCGDHGDILRPRRSECRRSEFHETQNGDPKAAAWILGLACALRLVGRLPRTHRAL